MRAIPSPRSRCCRLITCAARRRRPRVSPASCWRCRDSLLSQRCRSTSRPCSKAAQRAGRATSTTPTCRSRTSSFCRRRVCPRTICALSTATTSWTPLRACTATCRASSSSRANSTRPATSRSTLSATTCRPTPPSPSSDPTTPARRVERRSSTSSSSWAWLPTSTRCFGPWTRTMATAASSWTGRSKSAMPPTRRWYTPSATAAPSHSSRRWVLTTSRAPTRSCSRCALVACLSWWRLVTPALPTRAMVARRVTLLATSRPTPRGSPPSPLRRCPRRRSRARACHPARCRTWERWRCPCPKAVSGRRAAASPTPAPRRGTSRRP
mmetsp:Transcript_1276/g.3687  ORF Transcript_1276/g.3687 Transcript_1276/m.3687 type:complete len:325 (+) Transcript_1276:793-1767(+)